MRFPSRNEILMDEISTHLSHFQHPYIIGSIIVIPVENALPFIILKNALCLLLGCLSSIISELEGKLILSDVTWEIILNKTCLGNKWRKLTHRAIFPVTCNSTYINLPVKSIAQKALLSSHTLHPTPPGDCIPVALLT